MLSWRRLYSTLHRIITKMTTLETLHFDNLALRILPIDPEKQNFVRQVPGACFSLVKPETVKNPSLVAFSKSALALLDIGEDQVKRPEFVEYFSGNKILPGSEPAAHCYCGHQFGYFSGQLGDGAAMYLGEIVNTQGERWEFQLKGAGPTPYSRQADGRKVLRSSIREFLCSEAMYNLGIPTTRAGSCIISESTVVRDIFYNGNPINEKCTLVLRIAPTFLRFGSFEIFKPVDDETGRKGPSVGRTDILCKMLDYTIETFYKEIWDNHGLDEQKMYEEFYKEVVRRTARLVAGWQSVGWCHGVLNTDNMSVLGLTIDYGPYGFMDRYDPDFICNASDDGGRYTYKKQPEICRWNCQKFAEAIQEAIPLDKTIPHLELYDQEFDSQYKINMRKKFGLQHADIPEDKELFELFFETMQKTGADFNSSFRCLSRLPLPSSPDFEKHHKEVEEYLQQQCCSVEELRLSCKPRMDPRQLQMFLNLLQTNPAIVEMLGMGVKGIAQELERLEKLDELKKLTEEEKKQKDKTLWEDWLKKYVDRLKVEEKKVTDIQSVNQSRVTLMNSVNPRFVLRNYIAHNAIAKAENGDYSEVRRVLKILENPYSDDFDLGDLTQAPEVSTSTADEDAGAAGSSKPSKRENSCKYPSNVKIMYDSKPPSWALDLRVT
ncbi:hypothetical protein CHS0354_039034 [Potamilus streckersoni]|uniref:Selenoprotein O n=1 Tax=Potamilus streckersoni TaxID=2493646 RepID=A0AAE0VIP9_9BIVA|nr:hypothetical protein CHS0354_039034 [Potamilus streckersoni]